MLYPSAKALIYHPDNFAQLLMVRRNGHYEPAGGKLHVDFPKKTAETYEECALRECREELGATIEIEDYLGSFYFFWTIDQKSMSCCVTYSAKLISLESEFITNEDCGEFPVEPRWVHAVDIVNGNIPINSYFVGLEPIVKKFATYQLSR